MTVMNAHAGGGRPAEWMREAALLAVAHHLQDNEAQSWPAADWQPLTALAAQWPLPLTGWIEAAALAAERFPEAAAAFSILADNAGLHLPTPAVFARIAAAGLGVEHDRALAAALTAPGDNRHIELAAPPGACLPAAQWGLRLTPEGLARTFRHQPRAQGDLIAATHRPVMAQPARAAAGILAADGIVWLRSPSRRMALQLAMDLAALTPSRGFDLVALRPAEALPAPEDDGPPLALDLFALEAPPRIPARQGPGALILLAPDRFDAGQLRAIDAPAFTPSQARAAWDAAGIDAATADALAPRFQLTLAELIAARQEAEILGNLAGDAPDGQPGPERFTAAIRAAGARRMGPFVTNVRSDVTLDDLVAGREIRSQLADAIAWRSARARVWTEMGVPLDAGESQGLTLLFSGPPGGGKTFAARCLANALGLNLYRTDLSQVVSKYIGETEKNLSRIFDDAEAGHGILFFDEADAIFGKRSEVKDAHDRYANIEVGFLLQRLETFGGIVVLATNLRANLDPAFTRRMQFIVDFPMPQRAERELLWQRNLPLPDWCEDGLDVGMLAERFRFAGGNIRNAAVAAAHLAAAERARLGPRHLARAVLRELEKSGLPRGAEDLGPLARWLEEAK